ncbi:DUF6600 domain-containing protein, partial [Methylobacter psychrophilus]|uniref:DUF6600 domain-containing protein n=1 Tax=Methylobacter psychrophilus TaxID=96941 RepID=UPI0021D4D307
MSSRPRFGLIFLPLLIVILFSGLIPARQVYADSRVNIESNTFYDALAPYGNWVDHPLYGQVWYPDNVAQDWRPYTDGYWAYTDNYGWLWVSYEPWGWAPFHYGRWAWDNWYGWIWVPGRTWAPAWVFWRSGGGYAAWAPMPPNVMWQSGVGLNISYFNYDRDLRWDSWVAVREHDLPDRHISRHISPRSHNRQVINVTNYTNNVTLINNTIVNQGVPVKQIEEVTRRRVESVVPNIHDRADTNRHEQREGQPDIVRLPMTAPTHQEIQHNEELARRLDGKNTDGTRTELSVPDSGKSGNHEPQLPGRLLGVPVSVQSPYTAQEQVNPVLTEAIGEGLPKPAIPESSMLDINPDTQHKKSAFDSKQEPLLPIQRLDQQSSSVIPPMALTSPPGDKAGVPVSTLIPPIQDTRQPSELAKQSDNHPLQDSVVSQQQTEGQQSEYLQRQQKIGGLQEELTRSQDKLKQQQADHIVEPVPQIQSPEAVHQPERQNQQQVEAQLQQADHAVEPVPQIQVPKVVHQPEMQNQQQVEAQLQQADHAVEPLPQIQSPEAVHQPEMQNQQQVEAQSQQAERAQAQARQLQQQEAARQQELQNQQQVETQSQQAERAQAQARQAQQQEAARQQELQNQQQVEAQSQQAERAQEQARQAQQQDAARQQEHHKQQQKEKQAEKPKP